MKKLIRRPDGTEETVEGTPEEIAQYERALHGDKSTNENKKKPPVLRGDSAEKIIEALRQIAAAETAHYCWKCLSYHAGESCRSNCFWHTYTTTAVRVLS